MALVGLLVGRGYGGDETIDVVHAEPPVRVAGQGFITLRRTRPD
jgi:hypothetical protein